MKLDRIATYLALSVIWVCACGLFGFNQWSSLGRIAMFAIAGTTLLIALLALIREEQLHADLVEMLTVMGLVTAVAMLLAILLRFGD
jgi:hypothetical protein